MELLLVLEGLDAGAKFLSWCIDGWHSGPSTNAKMRSNLRNLMN